MKRSKFTDEQILYVLRQVEGGTAVADVCRQVGISKATFYIWKKKYASLGGTEIRELRQLREENAKLKRLVADLSLDKHILSEIIRKKVYGRHANASSSSGHRVPTQQVSRARVGWCISHAHCALIAAVAQARSCYGIGCAKWPRLGRATATGACTLRRL